MGSMSKCLNGTGKLLCFTFESTFWRDMISTGTGNLANLGELVVVRNKCQIQSENNREAIKENSKLEDNLNLSKVKLE